MSWLLACSRWRWGNQWNQPNENWTTKHTTLLFINITTQSCDSHFAQTRCRSHFVVLCVRAFKHVHVWNSCDYTFMTSSQCACCCCYWLFVSASTPPPPSPIPLRHKTKPKKPKQKDRSTVAWTSQMVRLSNISLRGNDSKMVPAEGSHQPHSGTWTSDKQSKIKLIAQPCKSSKIIRNNERKKQTKKGFLQNKCHVTWASQSGRFARQRAQVQVQLLDFLLLLLIITRQLHLQNEN